MDLLVASINGCGRRRRWPDSARAASMRSTARWTDSGHASMVGSTHSGHASMVGVDSLEARFAGRFDSLEARFDARIDALRLHLEGRIDTLQPRVDGRIDTLQSHLEGRFDTLQFSMDAIRSDLTQVALAVAVRPALRTTEVYRTRSSVPRAHERTNSTGR